MIERVIENWLTKSGERTYQVAFGYMLAHRGESVVHITRHCAMEMGKDVISIASDGVPCAYQLKGGDIRLRDWREEVGPQVDDLVMGAISHPSIDAAVPHRPFLVTNGRINEEVQRAIDDRNRMWESRGYEPLRTITHGEMLAWALDLGPNLWPLELKEVGELIELATWDGRDVFPKAQLAILLERLLLLDENERPNTSECSRLLASGALVTALAAAPFSEKKNHVAELEAWVVYASYVIALAERWELRTAIYANELDLAKLSAFNALGRLAEEVYQLKVEKRPLVEGDSIIDSPFYQARLTWMSGLLSSYALWRRSHPAGFAQDEKPFEFDVDRFSMEFGHSHRESLFLWGEAAIPQILAYHWAWRFSDGTWNPDWFVVNLARTIIHADTEIPEGLPSAYYEFSDLAPYLIDAELREFLPERLRLTRKSLGETFSGASSYLEGIFHLVVKKNYKQAAKAMWPSMSKISSIQFDVAEPWHALRWRNPRQGSERTKLHASTQCWRDVKNLASGASSEEEPLAFREDPAFALLHLIAFPHRGSAARIRWLDSALRSRCKR